MLDMNKERAFYHFKRAMQGEGPESDADLRVAIDALSCQTPFSSEDGLPEQQFAIVVTVPRGVVEEFNGIDDVVRWCNDMFADAQVGITAKALSEVISA